MSYFKNRVQPILKTHPFRPGKSEPAASPSDGEAMINDPGKHEVKKRNLVTITPRVAGCVKALKS